MCVILKYIWTADVKDTRADLMCHSEAVEILPNEYYTIKTHQSVGHALVYLVCTTPLRILSWFLLTFKVINFCKFTYKWSERISDSLKPLWSGMGEVVPARTSPTLHPPCPPIVL